MNSIKAVLAGCLFIIGVILAIQLATIFLMVGYNSLAKSWPFLQGIGIYFRYFLAYPFFFLSLFGGGYITAAVSKQKILLHCFLVGVITVGISTMSALDYMVMTTIGKLLVLLALVAVIGGGLFWKKRHQGI